MAGERRQPERVGGTRPSRELAGYVGTYFHGLYGDAAVAIDNGTASLEILGFKTPIEHWHYDSFRVVRTGPVAASLGPLVTFATNPNGIVHQLHISGGGGATFVRKDTQRGS